MKKNKNVTIFLLMLGTFFLSIVFNSTGVLAENDNFNKETRAGISFTLKETTNSSNPPENKVPPVSKPSIKAGGILPQTGEMMQSIMIVLIGWLVVIILFAIYLSIRKNNLIKEE